MQFSPLPKGKLLCVFLKKQDKMAQKGTHEVSPSVCPHHEFGEMPSGLLAARGFQGLPALELFSHVY